jgi:hypothetical protein
MSDPDFQWRYRLLLSTHCGQRPDLISWARAPIACGAGDGCGFRIAGAGAAFRLGEFSGARRLGILIFLPRRFDVVFFVPQYLIPFGFGLLYAGLIFANVYTVDGGFGSIAEVRALFSKDELLLAGWLHYLAFDLFIGAWIARQADALGYPRALQAVVLLATFMFGPVGLVLFLAIRSFYRRRKGPLA